MNIDWVITLLSAIVIFFGAIVNGIAGFGLAQIGMGLMPLFRSTASAAVIFSMVATVSNFRVWWSVKEEFEFKDYIKPVIGLIFGMPIGLYIFDQMNEVQVKKAIGIILLIAAFLIVIEKQNNKLEKLFKEKDYKPNWIIPVLVGLVAGILGGAVAIPGPPMILYGSFMSATGLWSNKKMKAIFTSFFGTLMFYRFISSAIVGNVSLDLIIEAIVIIPVLLLGAYIGIVIFNKLSRKIFSWIVVIIITINAIVLLFN